jgi:hypothetical protein
MTDLNSTVRMTVRKGWIVLLLAVVTLGAGFGRAQAALLDGLFTDLEESLSEDLAEKGETLTLGDFYQAEVPDAHGPIGTMGNHTHNLGEFMFSYRYMNMFMKGTLIGTDGVSDQDVVRPTQLGGEGFLATPTDMTMQMHMFSGMWGMTDTLTWMLMIPYSENEMNHITRPGGKFTTSSSGIGDIRLVSLWRLYAIESPSIGAHKTHFNFGLGFPTGSINAEDVVPRPPNQGGGQFRTTLPYPMQLGSGTFSIVPALTYLWGKDNFSTGVMGKGFVFIGRNDQDYSVGNKFNFNAWGAYRALDWLSFSARFNYDWWANYDGADPRLNPAVVYTADPNLRGGERLDLLGGANVLFPEYKGYETRLAVEYGQPIYQNLTGPQLATDHVLWLGFQLVH